MVRERQMKSQQKSYECDVMLVRPNIRPLRKLNKKLIPSFGRIF
jgi:hypothetical protein